MDKIKAAKRAAIGAVGIIAGVTVGLTIGGALASPPAAPTAEVAPTSAPEYAVNDSGQTYGSVIDARTPEEEPDLIETLATNGKVGYAYKSDLDAWGKGFATPEEALAWQEANKDVEHTVPVYEADGKTVIGEFVISNVPGGEVKPQG